MGSFETLIFIVIVVILLVVIFSDKRDNYTTGYAVTSGLAFNNRTRYCDPGNEEDGGAYGGGCFVPHKVII